jgi:hypothetical protein
MITLSASSLTRVAPRWLLVRSFIKTLIEEKGYNKIGIFQVKSNCIFPAGYLY